MWSECSWVMRIAASDCGSSPSDFIRLNVSRQEMPASTKILVRVLATNAQFPRLPLASIEIVTHMLRRIRASPVDWGVTFWLSDTWDEPGVRRLGRIRNWKGTTGTWRLSTAFKLAQPHSPQSRAAPD